MPIDKTQVLKWSLLALAAIVVGVFLYAIFATKTTTTTGGTTTNTSGGIGKSLGSILAAIGL